VSLAVRFLLKEREKLNSLSQAYAWYRWAPLMAKICVSRLRERVCADVLWAAAARHHEG
jgi:hypothetical protein